MGVLFEGGRDWEVVCIKSEACLDCGGRASFRAVAEYPVQAYTVEKHAFFFFLREKRS